MARMRISTGLAVIVVWLMAGLAAAQNPKPPTPLPSSTTEDDLPILDAVTLWIEGSNLTVYVDSTWSRADRACWAVRDRVGGSRSCFVARLIVISHGLHRSLRRLHQAEDCTTANG